MTDLAEHYDDVPPALVLTVPQTDLAGYTLGALVRRLDRDARQVFGVARVLAFERERAGSSRVEPYDGIVGVEDMRMALTLLYGEGLVCGISTNLDERLRAKPGVIGTARLARVLEWTRWQPPGE